MIRWPSLLVALVMAGGAAALDLPANARLTAERVTAPDRYDAPVAPFDGTTIPVQTVEGRVIRQTWHIPGVNLTVLQVLAPLRAQLEADGFTPVLDCVADGCGGFDFRFGTEVLPAPAMFVNLRNFRFLTLRKGPADSPDAIVTLLISAGANAARVQIIEARNQAGAGILQPAGSGGLAPETQTADALLPTRPEARPDSAPGRDLAIGLSTRGFHVLDGLDFETGATALGPGPFPVLAELAAFLTATPDLRVALVGHTDTAGGLDDNIAISRARARSVRQRLVDAYGIDPARLDAEGMGYLAPRASNQTSAGREANRRVEAVVLAQ